MNSSDQANALAQGKYPRLKAVYRPRLGHRYAGNPFIEALPVPEIDGSNAGLLIEYRPPAPTDRVRRLPETTRLGELNTLKDVIYPRPSYSKWRKAFYPGVVEAYHARNPMYPADLRRRYIISQQSEHSLALPPDWKSSGSGLALIGPSGTGKTTLADRLSLPLKCVIEHESYQGQPLKCLQIPTVSLVIPHDATLLSMCLQFFAEIDEALGTTDYSKQARARGTIAQMALLMEQVATTVSVGGIVIDELQHLRVARSGQSEFMLNLFTQLIERAGMFVAVLCTPAIEPVVMRNVRNLRKLSSTGAVSLDFMPLKSAELRSFQDFHWDYMYTRTKARLSKEIRDAWNMVGAGNPAFMIMAFIFAQRLEIGARERVDELSFARALKNDMYLLQPAITAIRNGNRAALNRFDDLVFTEDFDALRSSIGWTVKRQGDAATAVEFGEIKAESETQSTLSSSSKSSGRTATETRTPSSSASSVPTEDPRAFF